MSTDAPLDRNHANASLESNEYDVYFGRNPISFRSEGNKRLKERVMQQLPLYEKFHEERSGSDKSFLITAVVNEVIYHGGRFLKRHKDTPSRWVPASKSEARKKVSHLFRDLGDRKGEIKGGNNGTKKSIMNPERRRGVQSRGTKRSRTKPVIREKEDSEKISPCATPVTSDAAKGPKRFIQHCNALKSACILPRHERSRKETNDLSKGEESSTDGGDSGLLEPLPVSCLDSVHDIDAERDSIQALFKSLTPDQLELIDKLGKK